ncbi:MAG: LacI family DNA-binding transcriptional regulator [Eubacteriales bacterium]|nr:LacI family DNA-binding transcriptional regulator [Eubacteriales bacterium]
MTNPTIKEISKLANVSVSTVSRVINNMPDVNKETKQKVMEIIDKYDYIPNSNAKNLKKINSNIICIIVKGIRNMFSQSIVEKMQSEIGTTKYIPLVHSIDENENEVDAAFRQIAEKKPVGVILLGGSPSLRTDELKKIKVPCVFSTMSAEGLKLQNVSSVCIDDKRAAKKAVDYLFEMGHRKIAVLGGELLDKDSIYKRYLGALESYREHGAEFDEKLFMRSKFSFEGAYTAVDRSIKTGECNYSAIFAMSDVMAIGAAKAIFDNGLSIPEDVSIIGFDGIEMTKYYNPSLATVKQPCGDIAQKSIELLIKKIENCIASENIVLDTELVRGNSIKAIMQVTAK